jgi:hypothetical protein
MIIEWKGLGVVHMNEIGKFSFHMLSIVVGADAFGFFGVGQFKIVFCVSRPRPVLVGHSSGINLIFQRVPEDCFRG